MDTKSIEDLELEDLQRHQKLNKIQIRNIRENTWTKLYMLQNYDITMDMFKGALLRWSSLNTCLGYIRSYCNGKQDNEQILSNNKSMFEYIQCLMDSGTEPYPAPKNGNNKVLNKATLEMLIRDNILTRYQVERIYEPVGYTEEDPDTSSAWTCSTYTYTERDRNHMEHCQIVDEIEIVNQTMSNPIKKKHFLKFNPIKLKQGKTLFETIAEAFKQTI